MKIMWHLRVLMHRWISLASRWGVVALVGLFCLLPATSARAQGSGWFGVAEWLPPSPNSTEESSAFHDWSCACPGQSYECYTCSRSIPACPGVLPYEYCNTTARTQCLRVGYSWDPSAPKTLRLLTDNLGGYSQCPLGPQWQCRTNADCGPRPGTCGAGVCVKNPDLALSFSGNSVDVNDVATMCKYQPAGQVQILRWS